MDSGFATKGDHQSYLLQAIIRAELRGPAAPHVACASHPLRSFGAMNAVRACDPDRTTVMDRKPLPCVCVAWGRALARAGKLPPHHPAHPCPFFAAIALLCHRSLAPRKSAEYRGNTAPRHRRGVTPCRKIAKQLPNKKIGENCFSHAVATRRKFASIMNAAFDHACDERFFGLR